MQGTQSKLAEKIFENVSYDPSIKPDELSISDEAHRQLSKLYSEVDDNSIQAIRIFVAGGGCSGMSYGMTFTDQCTEFDKVLNCEGYTIFVDVAAFQYLKGVEIDYSLNEMGASFVFNNAFQMTGGSGTCGGCGGSA